MVDREAEVKRLTKQQWDARAKETGKSMAIMKACETVIAGYGDEALMKWQINNGLIEKPRIRVKATSTKVMA